MKPLLRRFSPDGAALWYYVRLFLGSIILAWSLNLLAEIQPQTIPEPLWCLVKVSPGDPVLVWSLCIFIFIIQNILIKLINNPNDMKCLWLSCPVTPWNPEWCFIVLWCYQHICYFFFLTWCALIIIFIFKRNDFQYSSWADILFVSSKRPRPL